MILFTIFFENPSESHPLAKIEAMAFSPKEVKIGKLHSIVLSDGEYVSHNFETPNRVMVEGLKRFDLVQINSACCPRDERHDWFGRHRSPGADRQRWESVEMTKPILGVEVDKLRKFNPATQKL